MTDDIEPIGELRYRLNREYPYPFAVERPPHFWMSEETGLLADAVELYLNGEDLPEPAVDLIRQYLRQYLERAVMTGDAKRDALLRQVAGLRTSREIERFADEIANYGVEPF
jgi:hypothetical protein